MLDQTELKSKLRAISEANAAHHVLDILESNLRRMGATHILITGLPMPNRPIDNLVQRFRWPDQRNDGIESTSLSANDSALMLGLGSNRARVWTISAGDMEHSDLLASAGEGSQIVVVPVTELYPFQAFVFASGPSLQVNKYDLANLEVLSAAAFSRLRELGVISGQRPGALSNRERRVLELTAYGKTAGEIADVLDISQRTVHAHLQNASVKLNASNKTHTVVEALRYGQISV
ncbi:MAG: helix-turn-helix transcriptional regulator [Roseibium album]|uniref:HTH-type quorum sensing-dependent transcriptional regulator VjbR n=1 Tax=Roseibium album TaxID=311410 RepID=A0A0M6Z8Y5_9HYPH|nr:MULTISPECIES: helix-turn-helix transcriptional regulator [Stappiaceae]MBG6142939.1 DNA-binding CsgD family transcriptional regulator [Labrenzia sp. EL_142]MBG6158027.1 DNA-binding CsgD family transcriptional regulator [Labrenzia sp. EL_162]MBG6165071.1 DNA-binding CsgD family transcriptional regulator [Labrenzia sp. EL_195]MBG6172584.1 DNA-binding CsgD family transcriptional regulator [Labrenzia sp. EL_132]MBG6196961.1 DNA-binding CsgD family transcriptional regulator [Labrenzia sp. EL_159]